MTGQRPTRLRAWRWHRDAREVSRHVIPMFTKNPEALDRWHLLQLFTPTDSIGPDMPRLGSPNQKYQRGAVAQKYQTE
jgi:hypothetical protein